MKKIIIGIGVVIIALFGIFYNKVNANVPHNLEINKFSEDEEIIYDNYKIEVSQNDFFNNNDLTILPIEYRVTNTTDKQLDIANVLLSLRFCNGLGESIVQNVYFSEEIPEEVISNKFKKFYDKEDFILEPREEKKFELYYNVDKDYYSKFPACIKFSNRLYWDKYEKKLHQGIFYYEVIELESKI